MRACIDLILPFLPPLDGPIFRIKVVTNSFEKKGRILHPYNPFSVSTDRLRIPGGPRPHLVRTAGTPALVSHA